MDNFTTIMISIIIMFFIGYCAKKTKLIRTQDVGLLNKIVVQIALPCLVFNSIYHADLSNIYTLGIIPFVIVISGLIVGSIVYLISKYKSFDKKKTWTLMLVSMCGNTAMIGFPICLGAYGNPGLVSAIFADLGSLIIFLILSVVLVITFGGSYKHAFKGFIKFPALWALLIGLIFNLLNISIFPFLINVTEYLADMTIPLIMISVGVSLSFRYIKEYYHSVGLIFFIKLLLYPFIGFLIGTLLNLPALQLHISVVEAGSLQVW